MLAVRLKNVLPTFISTTQNAFVKGRHRSPLPTIDVALADSVLLMHELVREYQRKAKICHKSGFDEGL